VRKREKVRKKTEGERRGEELRKGRVNFAFTFIQCSY